MGTLFISLVHHSLYHHRQRANFKLLRHQEQLVDPSLKAIQQFLASYAASHAEGLAENLADYHV